MPYDFETIGPYQVVDTLGQGGMGTVYQGIHGKTKDVVAIKVISDTIAKHARFRRRFDAEIKTLLRLKHPNIVQLIGFGEERGLLFYSMEYVAGENLHQKLRREKKIRWETVLDWAIEIGSALKHAHDLGVIHRDLKPANLMVTSEGHIKLTDFGIAKLFGASDETVPGSVLGTADYMPPEQAEGKPVTIRSDLYALGAICYTALAGRAPFTGNNLPEILFHVRYGNLTPLREIAPETPSEFCELIEELMKRDPGKRPPTTIVVIKRLQSLKIGLSRLGSTVPILESKPRSTATKVGDEATSWSLKDHPSLAELGNDPEQTRMVKPHASSSSLLPVPPKKPSVANPHDDTLEAAQVSHPPLAEQPSGIDLVRNTNYTQVTDSDRKRSTLVIAEETESETWSSWIGIAGLVVLLLACVAAGYWFSQQPSANSLYRPIAEALASEDPSNFESVEETAQRFLELYPEDARAERVASELEQLKIDRTIRQLQRGFRGRSNEELDALEQAFIDCSRAADIDPKDAKRKLACLLIVFPVSDQMSPRDKKLISAAKKMLERLESASSESLVNAASQSLEQQMRWAETHLSQEDRTTWLKSMIELYQEKPWAQELVKSAKQIVDNPP